MYRHKYHSFQFSLTITFWSETFRLLKQPINRKLLLIGCFLPYVLFIFFIVVDLTDKHVDFALKMLVLFVEQRIYKFLFLDQTSNILFHRFIVNEFLQYNFRND